MTKTNVREVRSNKTWGAVSGLQRWRAARSGSQRSRRSGNVLVLTAVSIVAMAGCCALAVDLGLLVHTKNRLQITCDASALAGAQELPASPDAAEAVARQTAQLNGTATPVVTLPSSRMIRVSAHQKVLFFFAPFLGITDNTVSATSSAGRSFAIKGIPEVVPLAITTETYEQYRDGAIVDLRLARSNKDPFSTGFMVGLDFRVDTSGKSGSLFQTDLTYGYPYTISIGENYNTLTSSDSSQGASMVNGMQDRFNQAAAASYNDTGSNYTFPHYHVLSRRIITVVVSDARPATNSNPLVPIRYFAPMYVLAAWQTTGSDSQSFMRVRILPGRAYNSDDPRIVIGDENTPDTGLTAVKLGE